MRDSLSIKNRMIRAAAVIMTGALAALAAPALANTVEKEVSVSSGDLLEIDLDTGGDITIIGWGQSKVKVVGSVEGRDAGEIDVDIQETSSGVRVVTDYTEHRRRRSSNLSFTINVPHRFDLDLSTMGGDVRIEGVEGELRGETMGGDLELSDLRGNLRMTTMGGDITLRDSELDGKVETMGGEVLFEDVSGDINGSSMGGEVIFRNVTRSSGRSTGEAVVISTMGGRIEVDDAPAGAELDTMGGEIVVRSAGEFVKAKTMGGDLTIKEIDGWVKGTTMGGDVNVVMVGNPSRGKRDVDLRSMGGEIYLTVPDGLDMTIDIELEYTKDSSRDFKIISDFPLNQHESPEWNYENGSPRKTIFGEGKVGSGEHRIKIRTVNGDVHLKKGR